MSEIHSIFGGRIAPEGGVSEQCVEELERLLEMAKSGEIKGFAGVSLHADNSGSYTICGFIGGYSMLGAAECMRSELLDIIKGYEE